MSQENKNSKFEKESGMEKGSRWYRNFNAAVGAVALGGALVTGGAVAAGLNLYAGFNFAQAGVGEVARRYAKKRSQDKKRPSH